jgi:hypothetical protein
MPGVRWLHPELNQELPKGLRAWLETIKKIRVSQRWKQAKPPRDPR